MTFAELNNIYKNIHLSEHMNIKIIFSIAVAFTALLPINAQKLKIGTYTFKDGAVYQGDLVGGKPNGSGKTTFQNGDVYEGEYVKGKRQGKGIYTFTDGEKYDGEWLQDQ